MTIGSPPEFERGADLQQHITFHYEYGYVQGPKPNREDFAWKSTDSTTSSNTGVVPWEFSKVDADMVSTKKNA